MQIGKCVVNLYCKYMEGVREGNRRAANSVLTHLVVGIALTALSVGAAVVTRDRRIIAGACVLSMAFVSHIASKRMKLIYEGSLVHTLMMNRLKGLDHWSKIDEGLYLGGIPLMMHFQQLGGILGNKGAVLTLLENFELVPTLFRPVQPQEWIDVGVTVKHLEAKDFQPVEQELIKRGIEFIKAQRELDKPVYVHCKAGKGRSATVVVCYLLTHGKNSKGKAFTTAVEAINFVASMRSQISLNVNQRKAIETYATSIGKGTLK